jgi:hypothetical protein
MSSTFDIFRKLPDNSPIWVEAVIGLEAVKQRLLHLAMVSPGEYIVFDPRAQRFIDPFSDRT